MDSMIFSIQLIIHIILWAMVALVSMYIYMVLHSGSKQENTVTKGADDFYNKTENMSEDDVFDSYESEDDGPIQHL